MKCAQCGREHKRRRFCSDRCKDRYHPYPEELDDMYPDHDEGWDGHKDSW